MKKYFVNKYFMKICEKYFMIQGVKRIHKMNLKK